MPSDAEVVEVLARAITDARGQDPKAYVGRMTILECNLPDARRLAAALRSAGYAVVKAADWAEVMRLAATSIIDTRPLTDAEIERTRQLVAEHGAPFTKDPTNA